MSGYLYFPNNLNGIKDYIQAYTVVQSFFN